MNYTAQHIVYHVNNCSNCKDTFNTARWVILHDISLSAFFSSFRSGHFVKPDPTFMIRGLLRSSMETSHGGMSSECPLHAFIEKLEN